ncbi:MULTISPECIES: lactonase family protein [Cohnella]|uniref:lactonase family protein n=1 Tax=Cohnella TaxID=329857 RepID=UPI0009BAACA3|nr:MULTISPECIES: lactonase family protein [Cohnella]MBN2981881.1 lactonase family protein [Cohnella algarum]
MSLSENRTLIVAGSYAEAASAGVYVYEFDAGRETLTLLDRKSGFQNPTFLCLDAPRRAVYALTETKAEDGSKASDAVYMKLDPASGTLTEVNRSLANSGPTCHIQKSADDRYLTLTSYHEGLVSLVELEKDGRIGRLLDERRHEGKSAHPERQDRPHPHSSFYSPDGSYLFVCDLGLDRIRAYKVDNGKLLPHGDTALHPGAGPRHLTFHPNGAFAFVINEVDSSIVSFRYDAVTGRLERVATVPTLPPDFEGENTCAEIAVSPDGKFLYGSNRGHDSIVVYAIDEATGELAYVEHASVQGGHPRHFSILPGGRHLLAANRDTNNLTLFRIDPVSGKLSYTGLSVSVSKPVCVWAATFAI